MENENNKPTEPDQEKPEDKEESLLDKAKRERILMEEANKKKEELLDREEKLAANTMLGGTTGGNQEVKPKEETDKEYSDRIDQEIREGKFNG